MREGAIRTGASLAMLLFGTAALAQARASTTAMSCGEARAVLQARGAAILGTGGFTYDRFVASRSFCAPTETTRVAFVPTADARACPIGFRCVERSLDRTRN